MKNCLLLITCLVFSIFADGQIPVTFRVDMTGQTVAPEGVHVMGNWQAISNGTGSDWEPADNLMTDENGDGIYELTVLTITGTFNYIYLNGDYYGSEEILPELVQLNDARFFTVGPGHAQDGLVLPPVKFGEASPEGAVAIRLHVDASQEAAVPEGIWIQHDFYVGSIETSYHPMASLGDGTFLAIVNAEANTDHAYRYIKYSGEGEEVTGACAEQGMRSLAVEESDSALEMVCFGACYSCEYMASLVPVTLAVDMSNEPVSDAGVFVAGDVEGALLETETAGIYAITIMVPAEDTVGYYFINGETEEIVPEECANGAERELIVSAEGDSVLWCFGSCNIECPSFPPANEITFALNTTQLESVENVSVLITSADLTWEGQLVAMVDENLDGIFTATIVIDGPAGILYKFENNGQPESENFAGMGCGEAFNGTTYRSVTREENAQVLDTVCFNSCENCVETSIAQPENELWSIHPNPASTNVFLNWPLGKGGQLHIYDITGKSVQKAIAVRKGINKIGIEKLLPGMYLLEMVTDSGEKSTKRLVIR